MHFIPLVLCFLSALLPLCVFDVLFFHLFYYCLSLSLPSLTSSFSLPVRREKIGDRVHELICLFIFIYWDINHWWSPIIPLLLSASVCVCACEQMWTQFLWGGRKWTLKVFHALFNWLSLLLLSMSTSAVCFYTHHKYTYVCTSFIWTTWTS